jgi:hypothetical protein
LGIKVEMGTEALILFRRSLSNSLDTTGRSVMDRYEVISVSGFPDLGDHDYLGEFPLYGVIA